MDIASSSTAIDLYRSILWQYDKATNLLRLFLVFNTITSVSTDTFWQKFLTDVLNVDSATGDPSDDSPFDGLETLGRIIGVQRPSCVPGLSTGDASDEFYRRILKGHLFLSFADASSASISKYLVMLFGAKRQIDLGDENPSVGDSVVVGGITYTFISSNGEYGEVNEVKIGDDTGATALNLANVINGTDGHSDQTANPNVSAGGASASGSVVTLEYEYWYAEDERAESKVVLVDHGDMTIDYRIADVANANSVLTQEERDFLYPYDTSTGILNGGQILGYSRAGERIFGYVDPTTGDTVENPAFPVLFPFPAGISTHVTTPHEVLSPLGLNETEDTGQNLANFVFDDSQPNGAPYAEDEEAT